MTRDALDSPLGVFQEQILIAVLRTRDEAYGMNVRREIERVTSRSLAIGAVYATLDRLEEKGLLESTRSVADEHMRRVFTVTSAGAQALAEVRDMRERLWQGVDVRGLLKLAGG